VGRVLFAIFTVIPIIEIAVFLMLGQAIGIWPTLLGIVVTAVLGAVLLRHQGRSLMAQIRQTVGRGQLPARALADAMMVGIAGVLLLTPGYFTDVLGILLLIPPVRTLIYSRLRERFTIVPQAPQTGPRTIDLDEGDYR
jgi:UPF0716 protein FxsA